MADPAGDRAGRRGRARHVAVAGGRPAGRARRAAADAGGAEIQLHGVTERPVLSFNRGFSAPIKVTSKYRRTISSSSPRTTPIRSIAGRRCSRWPTRCWPTTWRRSAPAAPREDDGLIAALAAVLADAALEPAFVALMLACRREADIARDIGRDIDPDAIFAARAGCARCIGARLGAALRETYRRMQDDRPYSPDAASAGTPRAEERLPRPARRCRRIRRSRLRHANTSRRPT